MSRIAYVNGAYVLHGEAVTHIEDRGYQFADGVYEVCSVIDGLLLDETPHFDRLERSLSELSMALPMSREALRLVMREVVRRNRLNDGMIYLQMTRGVAPRDHGFPSAGTPMSVVMTARSRDMETLAAQAERGVAVMTRPDIRWGRCDIKTVALLPNVLAKQAARDAGVYEAWLVDDEGLITEGSSTNAWIVDRDGNLVTRQLDHFILPGITRAVVMEVAAAKGLKVVERAFTPAEAQVAREAFFTAATAFVMPVVEIDGRVIGNGMPGSIATDLRKAYLSVAVNAARRPKSLPL